jgi:hypothetical protein
VFGEGLFVIFQAELQLPRGRLFGAAAELMT